MRIVINHLTRMTGERVCTAGSDLETGGFVRPLPYLTQLDRKDLRKYGGWCDLAVEVELRHPNPKPDPPHVEDVRYNPENLRVVRDWARGEFWQLLREHAASSLHAIFGDVLRPLDQGEVRRYAADEYQGKASLGLLLCPEPPELRLEPHGDGRQRLRLLFKEGTASVDAPVTDIRLYGEDQSTPDEARVAKLRELLRVSAEIILSVGLSRPYRPHEGVPRRHWLQVNNLHLAEYPVWRLGGRTSR